MKGAGGAELGQPGAGLPYRLRLLVELWDLLGEWDRVLGRVQPLIDGRPGTGERTEHHRAEARTHIRALRRRLTADLRPLLEELSAPLPDGME